MRVFKYILCAVLMIFGVFAPAYHNLNAASSEHLRDQVDQLKEAGPVVYCTNVAEFFDDGLWAKSMGIDHNIFPRPPSAPPYNDPDLLPRDGIRHSEWDKMTEHEKQWYSDLFYAGWATARLFIADHAAEMIENPHDFSGVIPWSLRMQLKQERFEKCLREWPPLEA